MSVGVDDAILKSNLFRAHIILFSHRGSDLHRAKSLQHNVRHCL